MEGTESFEIKQSKVKKINLDVREIEKYFIFRKRERNFRIFFFGRRNFPTNLFPIFS